MTGDLSCVYLCPPLSACLNTLQTLVTLNEKKQLKEEEKEEEETGFWKEKEFAGYRKTF